MINIKAINAIKDSLLTYMKDLFKKHGGIDPPMAIIIDDKGELAFVPMPFTSVEEKEQMLNGLKAVCKKFNPVGVCVINEAYVTQIKAEDREAFEKKYRAAGNTMKDFQDKKECAVMMFETNFSQQMICFDIDRANNLLINETISENPKGLFTNLLSPVNKN